MAKLTGGMFSALIGLSLISAVAAAPEVAAAPAPAGAPEPAVAPEDAAPAAGPTAADSSEPGAPEQFDRRRFTRHLSNVETCLACHGSYNPVTIDASGKQHSLWVDSRLFYQSVHARFGCQGCHTNIDGFGHRAVGMEGRTMECEPCHTAERTTTPTERTEHQQKMALRAGIDETMATALAACLNCHPEQYEKYKGSVHGQSVLTHKTEGVAFCTDCHGIHYILSADDDRSATNPQNVPSTCINCHGEEDIKLRAGLTLSVAESYESSFHGRRSELGSESVAVCTTCHGSHEIYAPSDPRSRVNQVNLTTTCGQCHEGAQLNFAAAFTHKTVSPGQQTGLYILQQIYSWVIFLLIAQFALFAMLDILRHYESRKMHSRPAVPAEVPAGQQPVPRRARRVYVRFNFHHRLQHFIMALSFTMLVVTGWPMRFPELTSSKVMSSLVGGPGVIGIAHRFFGVLLVLVSVYHITYLVQAFVRGRRSVAMLPSWRDAQEAWGDILYWLGRRRQRMAFGRYNWIEKVEYYAVVWGTAVMILSGIVIWIPTVAARFLPSWAIPASVIVHDYEALLAGLAIFVWHFYWVHLHPSVYPMSPVWLTGKMTEAEMEHHHPRELARLREMTPAPSKEQL